MANIIESLPLLRGWQRSGSKEKGLKIAEKTKKKDLVNVVSEKGYLLWIILNTDDPDTEIDLQVDGKSISENILSARDLITLGLVTMNPMGLFCPTFDTINERYIIMYMPLAPLPYSETLKISLKQGKQILTVRSFEHKSIQITDETLFRQGLKDLSSSK